MKTFILTRGFSGSGKSTWAKNYLQTHQGIEFNNDEVLTIQQGGYNWSPEAVRRAIKTNKENMRLAFKQGKPLIIDSNMNVSNSVAIEKIRQAKKFGYDVKIMVFRSFYQNQHDLPNDKVMMIALDLESNRADFNEFAKENNVQVEYLPIDPNENQEMRKAFDLYKTVDFQNLPYDNERHTFVTDTFLKTGKIRRLYVENHSKKHKGLRVVKYSKEVFWKNLFNDALLEMRGMVLNENNDIIVRPFDKVFNYSERLTPTSKYPIEHISMEQPLKLIRKANGFLGCATYVSGYDGDYNDKVLYSTTGSLDSSFAELNKKHTAQYESVFKLYPNHTFMFEICDKSDPHIIDEPEGAVFIGLRDVKTGYQFKESELDAIAKEHGFTRPETTLCQFKDLKEIEAQTTHEGYMVFFIDGDNETLEFKLKSPYYLVTKFLGRLKESRLEDLSRNNVDEEFFELIDYVKDNAELFKSLSEPKRVVFVRDFVDRIYQQKSF